MYKKVSTDMNFVDEKKKLKSSGKTMTSSEKVCVTVKESEIICSMTDLRQQMVNRISDTF